MLWPTSLDLILFASPVRRQESLFRPYEHRQWQNDFSQHDFFICFSCMMRVSVCRIGVFDSVVFCATSAVALCLVSALWCVRHCAPFPKEALLPLRDPPSVRYTAIPDHTLAWFCPEGVDPWDDEADRVGAGIASMGGLTPFATPSSPVPPPPPPLDSILDTARLLQQRDCD